MEQQKVCGRARLTHGEVDGLADCIQHGIRHILMVFPNRAVLELFLILPNLWAESVQISLATVSV